MGNWRETGGNRQKNRQSTAGNRQNTDRKIDEKIQWRQGAMLCAMLCSTVTRNAPLHCLAQSPHTMVGVGCLLSYFTLCPIP